MKLTAANTTINTIAAVAVATQENKGGVEMKSTKLNAVLTAAVINTATKSGAYVPKGLKVELVKGE